MFNLFELKQFVAFERHKTLTKVSEILNISQPTLTRSMHHIENEFGVKLFDRSKNKLELNDAGKLAAEYAKQILSAQKSAINAVREYDRKSRCITIKACAPKPLWSLAAKISDNYPQNEISSVICNNEKIINDVKNGDATIGILPYEYKDDDIKSVPYISEKLYICIAKGHALYNKDNVTFEELNGFNCLLRDGIGFWDKMCREKMPSSKFLIQTHEEDFIELIKTSSLLCFTTDLAGEYKTVLKDRKIIPITDECASIKYNIIGDKKCEYIKELPKL